MPEGICGKGRLTSLDLIKITEKEGSCVLRVKVQPGVSKDEIAGEHDGMLKLKIAAPPVDGKANEACRRFLAAVLKVPASAVEIKSGAASRIKVITVGNLNAVALRERLEAHLRLVL
jgi:uncharacterized protein (TIGR00251 family)